MAGSALVSVRGSRFVRPVGSLAAAAVVAAGSVVGIGGGVASAAAGCVAADMYAHHTVAPADATGGAAVAGAKFGAAVATGDFNNDGKTDVAVGAPNDTVGGAASGSVSVFLGTASGLGTGKRLRQADAEASDEEADKWGTSLATGDFNKDGFADLAVGAPGEAVGDAFGSGGISVFPGSTAGLTTGKGFNQSTGGGANEGGDAFGSALAAGDFNGDGYADLAIGVPWEVPGGETSQGGVVYVYKGSASGVVQGWSTTQESSGGNTEAADQYGAALAAGNVTGSSHADLVVGAPGEAPGSDPPSAGALYVVPGASSGTSPGFWRHQVHAGGTNGSGDGFGTALAIGNFDKDGFADIAVGVPGEPTASLFNSGSVAIFPGASTEVADGFWVQESQAGEQSATSDLFGSTLAAGDADGDGDADLLAGAPGKPYGSVDRVGASFLFSGGPRDGGSTVSVKQGRRIAQTDVVMENERDDEFGSAVALGDITGDGRPEAVIGASGEAPSGQPNSGIAVQVSNLAAPAVPTAVAVESSPTSVTQASTVGGGFVPTVEYAYVDDSGRLLHGHQSDPDDLNSAQWAVLSGSEVFSGRPVLAEQADGRLQIAVHNTDGDIWVNTQATKNPPVWGNWVNTGRAMASHPAIARQADGTLAIFAIDASGVLWVLHQSAPNAAYTSWLSTGVTGLTGTPVAVASGGGIQVFARDTSGDLKTAFYADRMLSGCTGLNGSDVTGTPAVVPFPGRTLWVFARAADGSVVSQRSDQNGVFPGTWKAVGSFAAAGSPAALLTPGLNGKLEIVARADDGVVHSNGETIQGSGEWRGWVRAIPEGDATTAATDPMVFPLTNVNGTSWAYAFRSGDGLTHVYVAATGSTPTFDGGALPAPPDSSP